MRTASRQRGLSAIEIVFGVTIILVIFLGLANAFDTGVHSASADESYVKAGFLAEEGIEAMRSMRDAGWTANISGLSLGTPYFLLWSNAANSWSATTTASQLDSLYTRTVTLSSVYRDSSDNIASSGTLDSGTRLVTVTVSWLAREGTTTRSQSSYLTNLYSN